MTRRSITQTLCAAALALVAPLAAFAGSRKRDNDPMVLAPDGRWYRASVKHEAEMDLLTKLARGGWEYEHSEALKFRADADRLRGLLAEAREVIDKANRCTFTKPAGVEPFWGRGMNDLLARIDNALK